MSVESASTSPALLRRGGALRGMVALNGVSALAQIGQYGIPFVLFPLALESRGVAAWRIGVVGSALWVGMLLGLLLAPGVVQRLGHRATVLAGLAASGSALLATPALPPLAWALTAGATGFGLGLRWIGLETWLYRVVPNEARGRLVGLHEALLGVAAVAGPALIALLGASADVCFVASAAFVAAAALPLPLAHAIRLAPVPAPAREPRSAAAKLAALRHFLSLGALIAGLGGVIEGAWLAVFPVYAAARGLAPAQTAGLLTLFGIGAMLLQFPLGWLADAAGLRKAALLAAAVTLLGALATGLAQPGGHALAALMLVLGGTINAFLTLGLIAATQSADPARLTGEVSRVSITYTGLSTLGPLAAGALASSFGPASLMAFTVALAAALIGCIVSPSVSKR